MPLEAPVNYMLNVPDPTEGIRKDLELAMGLRNSQLQQATQQVLLQEHQQKVAANALAAQQQQEFYQGVAAVSQNPSAEAIMRLMGTPGALPHVKELQERYKMLDDREKEAKKLIFNEVYSAFDTKNPDIAQKVLLNAAEASKNSGRNEEAQMYLNFAKGVTENPGVVQTRIGMALGALDEKFFDNYKKQKTMADDIAAAKSEALKKADDAPGGAMNLAKLDTEKSQKLSYDASANSSNATAARTKQQTDFDKQSFPLEQMKREADIATALTNMTDKAVDTAMKREKLDLEKAEFEFKKNQETNKLSGQARKDISEAGKKALAAGALVTRVEDVAAKLEKLNGKPGGAPARLVAGVRNWLGIQNEDSAIRKDAERLYKSELVKSLPPGQASDSDVAIFMQGYPTSFDSVKTQLQFMRGLAKVAKFERDEQKAIMEWTRANGDLASATRDFKIMGQEIKAGEDFEVLRRKLAPRAPEQAAAPVAVPVVAAPADASMDAAKAARLARFRELGARKGAQ